MPADMQKTKYQFLKRKMLIGLSGKFNFISELFMQVKCSIADLSLCLLRGEPTNLTLVIS